MYKSRGYILVTLWDWVSGQSYILYLSSVIHLKNFIILKSDWIKCDGHVAQMDKT
jgi:hypothetical protein